MCGNYSRKETIQGRKLFKGGNYSKAETIRGNTVFESVSYAKAATIVQVVSMGPWVHPDLGIPEPFRSTCYESND